MAHDAPPIPGCPFNLFQLHWIAHEKDKRITQVMDMPIPELKQYFYFYEEFNRYREQKK